MAKRREEVRAYHEAGHAVAARVLGVAITYASLFPTDGTNEGNVLTRSAAAGAKEGNDVARKRRAFEIDAIVSLAGPHAQLKRRPTTDIKRASRAEWISDLESARQSTVKAALLETNPDQWFDQDTRITLSADDVAEADRIYERVEAETRTLVEENWPAIERVASALLNRPLLLCEEIDVLIAGQRAIGSKLGPEPR